MAIDVAIESTIERPPDEVFATIADLDGWPGWLVASGIRAVRRQRNGIAEPGERLIVEQDAAGRAATFEAEVLVAEPGSRFALRGRDKDGVTIDIEAVVSADAASEAVATDLWWSIRIALPLRYRMFESMARPQVERAALLDIEGLRVRLEAAGRD
ncbi:MAG TPA: SRPBCC family protein [Candidatus Limnocylindrales bacterium]|nr:SRPBCC family protein [Candidatus Limnocylindrales bacterium]